MKKIKTQNTNPLKIKEELRQVLQLSIDKKLNGILELFDLKNKDDIELLYEDSVFDVVISIPKEGDINKISVLGIKLLETSNFEDVNKLRGILCLWIEIPNTKMAILSEFSLAENLRKLTI